MTDIYTKTTEVAVLTDEIERLRAQIRPLTKEVKRVYKERERLINQHAALATSPVEILAYSDTVVEAYTRLQKLVSDLHKGFYDTVRWLPEGREDRDSNRLLGVHATLDYRADAEYLTSFEQALRTFVAMFEIELPEDAHGYHYVSLMEHTLSENGSWRMEINLDADDARLVCKRWSRDRIESEGSIQKVLKAATELAWYRGGPDDDGGDY